MNTRTNIVLDDELVAQAMVRARVNTKKAAVEAALRAYVKKPDYSGLLALAGTGVIADGYDPKALFTNQHHAHIGAAGLLASERLPDGPASEAAPSAQKALPKTA